MHRARISLVIVFSFLVKTVPLFALEPVHLALSARSFQYTIFPIAQERGYMKEEGIDLRIVMMQSTPGLLALISGNVQFSGSGSNALVALTKGGAPIKTILAVNDQVLEWLYVRPNVASVRELKGKKIAVPGLATVMTFMLKQILPNYGIDGNKDVNFIAAPTSNRLLMLTSGIAEASIVASDERYSALNQGMKEILYFGNEVKNSWGTVATSDRFIKEQPKLMMGFMRAVLKAVRFVRKDREATINAAVKFTGMQKTMAGRMYGDLINTFTSNGSVDEETQRNDLAIVAQIAGVNEPVPSARGYDFSFATEADQFLNKSGWNP